MRWNTSKMNNGRSFQYTKFSVIDLVFTDKRNNSGKRPKSARGKPSSCRFSFPAARNAIEYEALCFSSRILVPVLLGKLERHRLWAIRIFQCFSNHNPKNYSTNDLKLGMVLPFIHQPDQVARKASDVSSAI